MKLHTGTQEHRHKYKMAWFGYVNSSYRCWLAGSHILGAKHAYTHTHTHIKPQIVECTPSLVSSSSSSSTRITYDTFSMVLLLYTFNTCELAADSFVIFSSFFCYLSLSLSPLPIFHCSRFRMFCLHTFIFRQNHI